MYYWCFQILINSPAELPVHSHDAIPIEMNQENVLMIKPYTLSSDYNLVNILPNKRNCLFKDEKPLQFFALYTYTNCILECESLRHISECGCVHFYMPSKYLVYF